ncbi:MAG: zinc finger CCCH domain-containing protein, partial [Candidatus Fonsibacter sp.]
LSLADHVIILLALVNAQHQIVPMTITLRIKWTRLRKLWGKAMVEIVKGHMTPLVVKGAIVVAVGAEVKEKGKGKRESKGKSAGAKADSSLGPDGRKWCPYHMKGNCTKGDACPNSHGDAGDNSDRGHSPSRDGKRGGSRWKRRTDQSS